MESANKREKQIWPPDGHAKYSITHDYVRHPSIIYTLFNAKIFIVAAELKMLLEVRGGSSVCGITKKRQSFHGNKLIFISTCRSFASGRSRSLGLQPSLTQTTHRPRTPLREH